jgi:GTP-binding protein EngB required for normal cell division
MRLAPRQWDLLHHQLSDDTWLTPRFLGGTDGSHHSSTLATLVRKGLAARSNRGGHTRNVWRYRRTRKGKKFVDAVLKEKSA